MGSSIESGLRRLRPSCRQSHPRDDIAIRLGVSQGFRARYPVAPLYLCRERFSESRFPVPGRPKYTQERSPAYPSERTGASQGFRRLDNLHDQDSGRSYHSIVVQFDQFKSKVRIPCRSSNLHFPLTLARTDSFLEQ